MRIGTIATIMILCSVIGFVSAEGQVWNNIDLSSPRPSRSFTPILVSPPGPSHPAAGKRSGIYAPAGVTSTFVVLTTNDTGSGSLRQAIIDANANPGLDTIRFNIPGSGVQTISLLTSLDVITDPVFIDGWSQGGPEYSGMPLIELDGSADSGGIGLNIQISDVTVRGLAINRFPQFPGNAGNGIGIGIFSSNAHRVWVYGDIIGLDPTGTTGRGNGQIGIWIGPGADNNLIGTNGDGIADAQERNIIAGTHIGPGILIQSNSNAIAGNFIGTDAAGTTAFQNDFDGIQILGGSNNLIGGTAPAERNLVSGNGYNGIDIFGAGAAANIIQGNLIGTDLSGTVLLPNGFWGILLNNGPRGTLIGGAVPSARNIIAGNNADGIGIIGFGEAGADSSIISGNVISANKFSGIGLQGGVHTVMTANLIGTDPAGTGAWGNGINGIFMDTSSQHSVIGTNGDGTGDAAERNIISGNVIGVSIVGAAASDNVIAGNFIGTDVTGTSSVANSHGVFLLGCTRDTVGGMLAIQRNLISGNRENGILIGDGASQNTVQGNYIGLDLSGSNALPNQIGVHITDGAGSNTIGAGNVISGNSANALLIETPATTNNLVQGNLIGTDGTGVLPVGNGADGILIDRSSSGNRISDGNLIAFNGGAGVAIPSGMDNSILGNSIFSNGGLGIDLGDTGVTVNDHGDTDVGANGLQNFPVLSFAAADLQDVAGTLNSIANSTFTIQFFSNNVVDPRGYGEGQTYLGSTAVTTDANGNATIFATFPAQTLLPGQYITATATDSAGNTSEFSFAVTVAPRVKVFGNHFVVNTTLSGIPLHWPDGNATYVMSSSVPPAFAGAITDGIGTWDSIPLLHYASGGGTSSNLWGGTPDGLNNIVWIPQNWDAITGTDSNTIALTRVRYNALTGEMSDVDMAFDAEHYTWGTDTSSANMNVGNVSTHEFGHFGGLGDIYDPGEPGYIPPMGSGNQDVTMFGFIRRGETSKITLDPADSAGIRYIYSNLPDAHVDLVLVFDGSSNFAGAYNGFVPSKNSSLDLIQKLRVGDRIGIVRMPATVVLGLTPIVDQSSRDAAKSAVNSLTAGGASAVGAGLTAAQTLLNGSFAPDHGKAVILFSACEEDTVPPALSVLPSLVAGSTKAFTFGFPGSAGEALADTIAARTHGAYFVAADTSIGTIVDQMWGLLIGQQLVGDTLVQSNNVPPYDTTQPGLKWQAAVDPGATEIQPGLKWQASNFVLTLISPDGLVIDSALAAGNPSDGIDFFSGPASTFFRIRNPKSGTWTLNVQGRVFPSVPEPLHLSILSSTDLTLSISFDRLLYAPGDPVIVTATLFRGGEVDGEKHIVGGAPVRDATVIALVTSPGSSSVQTLTLVHIGNGVYRGVFANTGTPGSYDFHVIASKPDEFNRESFQSVFVSPPIVCPSNLTVSANPGTCTAVVNFSVLSAPGVSVVAVPPSGSTFPIGTSSVLCIGSDQFGHKDSCSFTITVNPPKPSSIPTLSASPNLLWPPDHKFRTVTLSYGGAANCGTGLAGCSLSVSSSEPILGTGDGDTSPDWIIVDATHVLLRAERAQNGPGRTYTITLTCLDASNQRVTSSVTVKVPKSQKYIPGYGRRVELTALPEAYGLDQNYPNPFNPTTEIDYALPADSRVTLTVYNTLGEVVAVLADGVEGAGYRSAFFDAHALASGIYFVRLQATDVASPDKRFSQIRKMMLLK